MNGEVHNEELARLLRQRRVRLHELGKMIRGGMSRSHLSLTLNGVRPHKTPTGGDGPRPLTKTWRLLKDVLTAEEFAAALRFANERRERMKLPVLMDEAQAEVAI